MTSTRRLWLALVLLLAATFSVLLWQGRERGLVRRVLGQDLAVHLDGALAIAQLVLERLTEAELQRRDLARRARIR